MVVFLCALLLAGGGTLAAQSSEDSHDEVRGVTFYERFQGSANALGLVTRLDSTLGYNFNRYFGVDGGIPVYFVRPSETGAANGTHSANGIGNVYAQLRFTLANPLVNYFSSVTGTAPTGDRANGFSTGRATVDWTNHFERTFSQLTPFASVGIANSVSDTQFFVRPYTSLGFITHLEGGAGYALSRRVRLGASAYAILPSGQQTIVSRVVKPAASGRGRSRTSQQGVFETVATSTGPASIARDNGFSTWLQASPSPYIEFLIGYTRSVHFALDTVSFGLGVNVGSLWKRMKRS